MSAVVAALVVAGSAIAARSLWAGPIRSRAGELARAEAKLDRDRLRCRGGLERLRAVGGGRARRRRRDGDQLVIALDRIARALQAGTPLSGAFSAGAGAVGEPLHGELVRVAEDLIVERHGALERWAQASPRETGVGLVAAALCASHISGGDRARALDAVGFTLRERRNLLDEIGVQSAQARMSAAVVIAAPAGFALLVALVQPSIVAFLLTTPAGVACTAVALILDAIGACWIACLIRRATW